MAKRKKRVVKAARREGSKRRSCVKFKVVKVAKGKTGTGRAFRCVEFQAGKKHPNCPPGKLRGGGRSQKHIRPSHPSCTR